MKHVVVIGAGLGGLAAALRMAHRGLRVTVLEKNDHVGGKMGVYHQNGYTFDTGPTLLTMPFVVHELFQHIGCVSLPIELMRAEPICRYYWPDGSVLEATSDMHEMARALSRFAKADGEAFIRFLHHGKQLYRAAVETFLFHPVSSFTLNELVTHARLLPRVFQIDGLRSYERAIRSFFRDARTQQFFLRFATYNGSSPYKTPATMAVIPYIEMTFGGWYIKGGMYRLAQVMEELAVQKGVELRTRTEVRQILVVNRRATGVQLSSGETLEADAVLANADAEYTDGVLLGQPWDERDCQPSLSGFVLLLGVRKKFPHLGHHTILFSDNYRDEFDTLDRSALPKNLTLYICNSSASDETQAPAGCSNLFLMVNAPPLTTNGRMVIDWTATARHYREAILKKMQQHGFAIAEAEIDVEQYFTPLDFQQRFNAAHGAIYGQASNTRRAAFFRPPNRSRRVNRLYYAGGSAHPGGGIPLVLLSGKHAANLIAQDLCA